MIAPIGTAVVSLIPTRGATIEPIDNGNRPNTALALPARCLWFRIASVKELVAIMPIQVMKIKIGITIVANGP